jgi:hypothetical protein
LTQMLLVLSRQILRRVKCTNKMSFKRHREAKVASNVEEATTNSDN